MSLSKKAEKAKKLEVKPSVLEWCKQQVAEGNELSIRWDGGGDSGWCYFQINGEEANNEYTEYLTDMMYSELDYGSWAGEFSAEGEAIFNADQNAFIGTDYYSEDENQDITSNIDIRIPKDLWFDSISLRIEADYDEEANIEFIFNISNGFHTSKHDKFCNSIQKHLKEEVSDFVDKFTSEPSNEYRGMWNSLLIEKNDLEDADKNYYLYQIKSLTVRTASIDEKGIYLGINEDEVIEEKNEE